MKKILGFAVLALIVSFGVQANVTQAGGGPEGPYLVIDAGGTGNGQVISSDNFINCFLTAGTRTGDCGYDYFPGPFETTLTATASSSSHFVGWNYGECGTNPTCTASSTENGPDVYITATFDLNEEQETDTDPTITLTGANPQIIIQNSPYTELSATASDLEDGDISANIVITGTSTIDTSVLGDNTVTYSVTDSDENSTSTTRTVRVVAPEAPPVPPAAPSGGGGGANGPIWQTFGVSAPAVLGACHLSGWQRDSRLKRG